MKFKSLFEIEQEIKKLEKIAPYLNKVKESEIDLIDEKYKRIKALKTQTEDILKMIEKEIPTTWLHPLFKEFLGKRTFTPSDIENLTIKIKQELLTAIQGEQDDKKE